MLYQLLMKLAVCEIGTGDSVAQEAYRVAWIAEGSKTGEPKELLL
jgi:hypothetical protein